MGITVDTALGARAVPRPLGVSQGDPTSGDLFNGATWSLLQRATEAHPALFALAYADNVFLVGNRDALFGGIAAATK